jgi:catechol 2,3-dioxygenase-like lactoylglutathione lyase family enzyme
MFDHVSIGVRDLARTKRFYDAALAPLGYQCLTESPGLLGYGGDGVVFWISPTETPVPADPQSGLHFCFNRRTRPPCRRFTPPPCARAAVTMACPGCGPNTAPITTPPS